MILLTVWDPPTRPCHTDPAASWPGRRWLRRPPAGSRPQRRWLCRPPGARTRTPHSVHLCTTSSPRRDTWGGGWTCDDLSLFCLDSSACVFKLLLIPCVEIKPDVFVSCRHGATNFFFFFWRGWMVRGKKQSSSIWSCLRVLWCGSRCEKKVSAHLGAQRPLCLLRVTQVKVHRVQKPAEHRQVPATDCGLLAHYLTHINPF